MNDTENTDANNTETEAAAIAETQAEQSGAVAIPQSGTTEDVDISGEISRDFMDYSMSVIVGRALPDVRDGLKPVHRRCLYAMHKLNLTAGAKHLKSARVVGDVIGKYHPHGDSAVYETIVRMAQPFSMRSPLVDGHGNFGSIDGDKAAAMRYTEVRMQRISDALLEDIEKNTVDMVPNYDGTFTEPSVMPAKLPNLLLNGSSGIAVGMATNIPPHNLGELCDGISYYIDHRDCSIDDLMKFVKGPDFPTGATIYGRNGIAAMYKLGRGQLTVRGDSVFETEKNGRERIVITSIPYNVNKADMIKHMADLVKEKVIEGISDIRDESKEDIRIIVDLKRDAIREIVLEHLYRHTALESTFGAVMLAIDQGRPKMMTLKDFFRCYVNHRFEVITRRTKFELEKALARKHILDGLLLAISHMDDIVEMIKTSANREEAKSRLVKAYGFSDVQVNAILEMRLYQLTGLERQKLEEELAELNAHIADLRDILSDAKRIYAIIKQDLADLKTRYGERPEGRRRTQIAANELEVSVKDLIADEPCVITLSNRGYIKRVSLDEYKEQGRGGHGVKGAQIKEEDFLRLVYVAETHDSLLFFTNTGRLFMKDAYEIPEAVRTSPGKNLRQLLELQDGEQILRLLPIRSFDGDIDIMFATKRGTVKKTLLGDYKNVNRRGIKALGIDEGDELVEVRLVKPDDDVIMITHNGFATRFASKEVRRMGRQATGVTGFRMRTPDDAVCAFDVVDETKTFLVATENGFAKRTPFSEYTAKHRGSHGIIAIKGAERNGKVVAAHAIADNEALISISSNGLMVRQRVADIRIAGRAGQGVRLVRLSPGATLVSVSVVEASEEDTAAPAAELEETAETSVAADTADGGAPEAQVPEPYGQGAES